MLSAPLPAVDIAGVERQLIGWNAEADQFRTAALSARRDGVRPSAGVVAAAEETQIGLATLLDEIDRRLDDRASGEASFPIWLRTRVTALALLESIGNSLDALDRLAPVEAAEPMRIGHDIAIKTAA